MAGIKELAEGRGNLYAIDPRKIETLEGWNAREDYGDVESLMNSIVESGLREPLKGYVQDGRVILTNGHRRLKVIMQAIALGHEIKTVPFLPEDRYANEGDYLLTQILSNEGKPLTPLEQARVFRKLLQFGWSEADIAKKTGKTSQTVKNYLELSAAAPQVHEMVATEQVSATLALATIREHGEDAGEVLEEAIATARSEGKTKATAKHVDTREKKRGLKAIVKSILEDAKVVHLESGVSIDMSKDQWTELCYLLKIEV